MINLLGSEIPGVQFDYGPDKVNPLCPGGQNHPLQFFARSVKNKIKMKKKIDRILFGFLLVFGVNAENTL